MKGTTVQISGEQSVRVEWLQTDWNHGINRLCDIVKLKNTKKGREVFFRLPDTTGRFNAIGKRGAYDRKSNTYAVTVIELLDDSYQFEGKLVSKR